MKVTFLGTGTSVGVPRIACRCPVCVSTDPKNKRTRSSILVEYDEWCVLVDTAPDLRTQALTYEVDRVDAVIFTHGHADHLHGLDDVRIYCFQRDNPLPCYGDDFTLKRIRRSFDYAFNSPYKHALPQLDLVEIDGDFDLFGLTIRPVTVYHGKMPVLAFRMRDFAYVTDCNSIPQESMEQLRNLDILVLDALRHHEHPTHFTVDQACEVIRELEPEQAYLTHIAHELDHATTNAALPENVQLAFDGLVLDGI